ncbi:MAG: hypothetical protein ACREIA_01090 [Opitutaceae bacterium]
MTDQNQNLPSPQPRRTRPALPAGAQPYFRSSSAPVPLASPRVKLATAVGETAPLGASLTLPRAAALPERGAPFFLILNLLSAVVAATFLLLIITKL